jgi:hypothetical protein
MERSLRDYFTMMPFGYRTRMNEMLNRKLGPRSVLELAAWFRERHSALHPREPGIRAVRFVSTFYLVGTWAPSGRWVEPPLESFPESERLVWFTRVFGPGGLAFGPHGFRRWRRGASASVGPADPIRLRPFAWRWRFRCCASPRLVQDPASG